MSQGKSLTGVCLAFAMPFLITCDSERTTEPRPRTFQLASVSGGLHHTCGLTIEGTVYCWGRNSEGELGDGTSIERLRPVRVATDLRFASVSAGTFHSCALTPEGVAYCWGWNLSGSVGSGDLVRRLSPSPVVGGLTFNHLTSGDEVTCGVTVNDEAYCWGSNRYGQLGAVSTETCDGLPCSAVPLEVSTSLTFVSVDPSGVSTCALDAGGTAFCWGDNEFGELGNGTMSFIPSIVPREVAGGHAFRSISVGRGHACGITLSGDAYCWGDNSSGQLGVATVPERCNGRVCSTLPIKVATSVKFASVSAGSSYSCALTDAGTAYCWGSGGSGELGDGRITFVSPTPVLVSGGHDIRQMSIGSYHGCLVDQTRATFCWGGNSEGPLGNGGFTESLVPAPVLPPG